MGTLINLQQWRQEHQTSKPRPEAKLPAISVTIEVPCYSALTLWPIAEYMHWCSMMFGFLSGNPG